MGAEYKTQKNFSILTAYIWRPQLFLGRTLHPTGLSP